MIDNKYFKQYRALLGFSKQDEAKNFLKAKDVCAGIDYAYIDNLNARLCEIIDRISTITSSDIAPSNISSFKEQYVNLAYKIILNNKLLPKLNNQGRRPEEVYFSWMRGYILCKYFHNAISKMFCLDEAELVVAGDDDLENVETFSKSPKADLQFISQIFNKTVRLEIQSGFSGTNDIKQHKVREAKSVFANSGIITLVIHFDIFNGQAAVLRIDNIADNNINWITRQQFEGQTVFTIDQNCFIWKLTENPPSVNEIAEIIL